MRESKHLFTNVLLLIGICRLRYLPSSILLLKNTIYYIRLCFKIRFTICDCASRCDVLYLSLHRDAIHSMRFLCQTAIYYMRFCIKIRFIICNFVTECDLICAMLYPTAIYYMQFCITM